MLYQPFFTFRDGFERFSRVFEEKLGSLQEEMRTSVLELRSCLQSPPASQQLVDLSVVKKLLLQTSPSNDDIRKSYYIHDIDLLDQC